MKISQREARRLKKRVKELELQADSMRRTRDVWYGNLMGARKLGKVLIARVADNGEVSFYAC
jgi:hypothetical protein